MPITTTPHFNRGTLPLAFVFSVPGADEMKEGRPVAGETGLNLTLALKSLAMKEPNLFTSPDRYAYRITNAFDEPMAMSLKSGASEPKASQIREPSNMKRAIKDLQGCSLVVLCGRKAQLLTEEVVQTGAAVVHACHTGNRALIAKYKGEKVKAAPTPLARRELRAEQWAEDLLSSIRAARAA
jgi:hypothetical protein